MLPPDRLRLLLVTTTFLVTLSDACNFYCFVTPPKNEVLNTSALQNINCTHFVYGYFSFAKDGSIRDVTTNDHLQATRRGNVRTFLGLRSFHPSSTLLMGLRHAQPFRDIAAAEKFASKLAAFARENFFDGVYLNMENGLFEDTSSVQFLSTLSDESATLEHLPTLALSAHDAMRTASKLADVSPLIEHLLLVMKDVPSSEDAHSQIPLDALKHGVNRLPQDSIAGMVDELEASSFPLDKIVVGLTPGGRQSLASASQTSEEDDSHHISARILPWQSVCRLSGKVDPVSASRVTNIRAPTPLRLMMNWTSANTPTDDSLGKKMTFAASRGLAGIGLMSLKSDDPEGVCSKEAYPFHVYVSKNLRCEKVIQKREVMPADCKRYCYFDAELRRDVDWAAFDPKWCSHVVVGPIDIDAFGIIVKPSANALNFIDKFNVWRKKLEKEHQRPPKLILSIGSEMSSEAWRMQLLITVNREILVANIVKLVVERAADGVEISWTQGRLDKPDDKTIHADLVRKLAAAKRQIPNLSILVAVSPESSFRKLYDFEQLKLSTDFIVLHTHAFHSSLKTITGHHAPLFSKSDLLSDRKMTVEGLTNEWLAHDFNSSRLIVSLTAAPMTMSLANSMRSAENQNPFSHATSPKLGGTSKDNTVSTQAELCAIFESNETEVSWNNDLAVPYLFHKNHFVAYDNKRSVTMKTAWFSTNNFGGIAIHGLEADDPEGSCPGRQPYPILQTVANTQVCKTCTKPQQDANSLCSGIISRRVACSYTLGTEDEEDHLTPDHIPFEKCTEVVVETASLDANGKLSYESDYQAELAKNVSLMAAKKHTRGLVLAIACNMTDTEFKTLVAKKKTALVNGIVSFVNNNKYTGAELRCADLLTRQSRAAFAAVIRAIRARLAETNVGKKCAPTLSIRLPVWLRSLRKTLDVSLLNSLHHVVLEPFGAPYNGAYAHSPLFPIEHENATSIDTAIGDWIRDGLQRNKILLQIPSYGMLQQLSNITLRHVGAPTEDEYSILGQSELCKRLRYSSTRETMAWDSMSATASSNHGDWISHDNQLSVHYKMRYAVREQLAGIGLMTLNLDDHKGTCGSGAFPILKSLTNHCY